MSIKWLKEDVDSNVVYHYTKWAQSRYNILSDGFQKISEQQEGIHLTGDNYGAQGYGFFGVGVINIDSLNLRSIEHTPNPSDYKPDDNYDGIKYRTTTKEPYWYLIWDIDKLNYLPRFSYFNEYSYKFIYEDISTQKFKLLSTELSENIRYYVGANSILLKNIGVKGYENTEEAFVCPTLIKYLGNDLYEIFPLEQTGISNWYKISKKDLTNNIYELEDTMLKLNETTRYTNRKQLKENTNLGWLAVGRTNYGDGQIEYSIGPFEYRKNAMSEVYLQNSDVDADSDIRWGIEEADEGSFDYNTNFIDTYNPVFENINAYKKQLNENTNVDAPIRAWVANLGKYNEGELVGAWVDFPIDEDELQKILHDKVLIGTEDEFGQPYEEYAIFDWESDYVDDIGEYENLDTINEWAEYIDSLQSWELDTLEAAKEAGYVDNILDFDPNRYVLLNANDEEELGYLLVDDIDGGVENLDPETIERYFDYAELGRELDFDLWGDEEMSAAEFWCGREEASDRNIGEAFVDDVGIEGVRNPENYFDYTEYGRDWSQFDGEFTSKGFIYRA